MIEKESPKLQDQKVVYPMKKKECSCRYSRCLKLYCECFASGTFCNGCNCKNCHNSVENEAERTEAIETILERKPDAFKPKITNCSLGSMSGMANQDEAHEATIMGKHNRGCNCEKSECLKKYCDCFVAKVLCSDNCKCKRCKNVEGSNETISSKHEVLNAAILEGTRSCDFTNLPPTKKRKNEQLRFSEKFNDDAINRLKKYRKNFLTPPVASPSFLPSSATITNLSGSSYLTHRSLLVDILQSQHLNELCSLLVISAEAAKKNSERKHVVTQRDIEHVQNSIASSTLESRHIYDRDDIQKLSFIKKDGTLEFACQSVVVGDGQKEDSPSPETLALICDEEDITTTRSDSPVGLLSLGKSATIESTCLGALSEVDAELERFILTTFSDFLNQLITRGST